MAQQADCIDKSVYDELKNMMKSKFVEFLQSYVTSMDEHMKAADNALSESNLLKIRSNVHPIIATSYLLGAIELSNIAKNIQNMIEEHEEAGTHIAIIDVASVYERLVSEYAAVKTILLKDLKNDTEI